MGRRPAPRRPVRPPWALAEELFTDVCKRCMACAKICPQGILIQGAGGYPETDFRERGCTFCGECVTASTGCGSRSAACTVRAITLAPSLV